MPGKLWTEDETEKLKEIYSKTDISLLIEIFGRTRDSIIQKASRLNLRKEFALKTIIGGYIYVMDKENPGSIPRGYILEHRKVMEEHIGRYLSEDEVVHHINEVTTDNRIENLQLMTKTEHSRFHNLGKKHCVEASIKKSISGKLAWIKRKSQFENLEPERGDLPPI